MWVLNCMGPLICGYFKKVNPTALHDPQSVEPTNAEEFQIWGLTINYTWTILSDSLNTTSDYFTQGELQASSTWGKCVSETFKIAIWEKIMTVKFSGLESAPNTLRRKGEGCGLRTYGSQTQSFSLFSYKSVLQTGSEISVCKISSLQKWTT